MFSEIRVPSSPGCNPAWRSRPKATAPNTDAKRIHHLLRQQLRPHVVESPILFSAFERKTFFNLGNLIIIRGFQRALRAFKGLGL
jgi:hypothetical protein